MKWPHAGSPFTSHNAHIASPKQRGARNGDAAMPLWLCAPKNNRPLPQSAREVGQANREIMTIEAKQRRVRRKFTARPSVQHASCRAGTAAFRASGSKGNETTRAQTALITEAWMTDEAYRRRRSWRTTALNVGARMTRERTKRRRTDKRRLSRLEPGRQPHRRLAAPFQ